MSVWVCDDELITEPSILLTTMMNSKHYNISYKFFQEQQQTSRKFPVFSGVVDTLLDVAMADIISHHSLQLLNTNTYLYAYSSYSIHTKS